MSAVSGRFPASTGPKKAYLDQVRLISDDVADGEYVGRQSGYSVEFDTPNGTYVGKSTMGVRGLNVPCKVIVKDGFFEVTPLRHA